MTVPAVDIIIARETEIDVVFDQSIQSPLGRPGEGFTFKVNGASAYATDADIVSGSTVRFLLAGTVSNEDLVEVSFDNSVANLLDAATLTDPADSFTDVVADNQSQHAALLAAVCALSLIEPEVITLVWSLPLTSANFATGLTCKANGVLVDIADVELGQDPRQLRVIFAGGFQYRDEITFSYNPASGDWQSNGYDIKSFVDFPVTNASRLGTPTDDYPLSSIVREKLVAKNGSLEATIGIDLNLVDQELVNRYGPALVDFGGTFGVTTENPNGIFIPQDRQPIKAGMRITKRFTQPGNPSWAQVAADEWLEVMTQRIATALGILRTTDQQVILGERTVRQV